MEFLVDRNLEYTSDGYAIQETRFALQVLKAVLLALLAYTYLNIWSGHIPRINMRVFLRLVDKNRWKRVIGGIPGMILILFSLVSPYLGFPLAFVILLMALLVLVIISKKKSRYRNRRKRGCLRTQDLILF